MAGRTWFVGARLCIVAALTYAFFFSGGGPNQATRMALTESIVVRHQPDITPFHGRTIDKGYKDGKFYADKAPGLSLLAVPVFAVMQATDRLFKIPSESRAAQQAKLGLLTFLFAGLAGVACAQLLLRLAMRLGCRQASAELAAFAYAFGTIAFPFSTVLFGHQLAALCILASAVLLIEHHGAGTLRRPRTLASLGALWSLSLVVEYPTSLLIAAFGTTLLVLTFDRAERVGGLVRVLAWTAAGGIPILAIHAAFLFWSYGKFALPYVYVSEPYFRAHMSGGILGIGVPTRLATYGSLLSAYRGILFFCPVVGLAVVGLGSWLQSSKEKTLLPGIVGASVLYLLFCCSYYAWDGGGSVGPRHLLPVLPFFLLLVAFFADRSRITFAVTLALTVVSCVIMLATTAVLVQLPLGDPYQSNPFYDVVVRHLLSGEAAISPVDAYVPYYRGDGAFNAGMMLGLPSVSAMLVVVLIWAAGYGPVLLQWIRRPRHA